jgi:hypothetical protein
LVLTENPNICIIGEVANGCPIHLFVQGPDKTYKHYEGPKEKDKPYGIEGREIGISETKTNGIKNLFYNWPLTYGCDWKWSPETEKDQGLCVLHTKYNRHDSKKSE